MPIEILMPALSPTMKEGNLANWLKKEGDQINAGDVIAEIETDKATMEVEAVDEGILGKIIVPAGTQDVPVNDLIALILEDGEDKSTLDSFKAAPKKEAPKPEDKAAPAPVATPAPQVNTPNITRNSGEKIFATPLAKRIAALNNVDIASVGGSGPRGRITRDDVMNSGNGKSTGRVQRIAEEYIALPNNNIRKVIASRLQESKQTIPHFYLTVDLNIDKLLEIRSEINGEAMQDEKGRPSYKISVNDFIIKASALALRDIPAANSSWTDEAILQFNNVDISVAVAIDGGLITPIVRNADQKDIFAISTEMKELAKKAKANKLQPEEFQGGGFSISNLGMYGIKQFNAIVNPPQSCILAIGAGEERALVKNGEFYAANMVSVTLSSDHRVVDGAVGAEFLNAFKHYVEKPVLMLL